MPIGDGKVAARDRGVLGTQCRVWTPIVTEAGRALPAIHAVTPITGAKPHVAFAENELDILLHVTVAGATAEGAACRNLVAAFAGKTCRGEKLFEGCARFLHRLRINQLGEIEVGTHIGAISHDAADVAVHKTALHGDPGPNVFKLDPGLRWGGALAIALDPPSASELHW